LPGEADAPRLIPFEFATVPVSESSLAQLAKRKIATLLDAGDALLAHSTVHNPRNALILELESLRDHGLLRARQISELYDGGRMCITFTFRDWRPAAGVSLKRASAIWQDAHICVPPLASGFKRIVNEEAGYQCAVPDDWVIDQADTRLLVLRKPGFRRTRPGLIVQTDLSARRPRTIDAMAERLLGTPLAVTIGNRDGILVRTTEAPDPSDLLHILIPEPTDTAAYFIQLCVGQHEAWIADAIRNGFHWRG
jgi:hypothetical protein